MQPESLTMSQLEIIVLYGDEKTAPEMRSTPGGYFSHDWGVYTGEYND
jgi:hypothetical protein